MFSPRAFLVFIADWRSPAKLFKVLNYQGTRASLSSGAVD
jgi:hypothetical protein